jgi:16S rRNA processing protein RimM
LTGDGPAPLLDVGRVGAAHGLRGEVVVVLTTDRLERVAPGSVLQSDRGPLEVVASRPSKDRHIVRFAGTDDRESAEALRGTVLRAEPLDDPDVLWIHHLVGCTVVELDGTERGVVEAVQHNPASDLLVLAGGALVPLRFVVQGPREEVDGRPAPDGRIHVDVPAGLFDL